MGPEMILPLLAAAVQSGTPILYATLGEIITEKSGILNLGVEGMMVFSALCGFLGALFSGSPWIGLCCGAGCGSLMAAIHGLVCIGFRGNQVVSGLALTILGTGLANYLGTPFIGQKVTGFHSQDLPLFSKLPVAGEVLFQQDLLVYLSFLVVPAVWFLLQSSRWGMRIRASGENPDAVLAAGVSPNRCRWLALLLGGALIGVGGAYLSLAYTHSWTSGLSAGRGWIAVALVIFAFWNPFRAAAGAYLFGGVMAFQFRLQASGTHIPSSFLLMLPYLLTVLVLVISSAKGAAAPAHLGQNIDPAD